MRGDTKNYVDSCKSCIERKKINQKAPLLKIPVVLRPFKKISMDILGPLPLTQINNKFILVINDYLTRWPETFALQDQKAETIARCFIDNIVTRFGVPEKLLTDQGTNFCSKLMLEICKILGINKLKTSPYHLQANGLTEI